jgi:hypothetical protein
MTSRNEVETKWETIPREVMSSKEEMETKWVVEKMSVGRHVAHVSLLVK